MWQGAVIKIIVMTSASAAVDHFLVTPYLRPLFPKMPGKPENETEGVIETSAEPVSDPVLDKAKELGF